jgi:hypothetical protein
MTRRRKQQRLSEGENARVRERDGTATEQQ